MTTSGTVTELEPGRVWVHVPAGYDGSAPASLVVFQDGASFLDPDEVLRAGVVLDDLVSRGELPPTVGVFVEPPQGQRNEVYDAFDDRYATYLVDEVLPEVARRWPLSGNPARRAVAGFSSGGSCAFTAAWLRPDAFGAALCFSASFAQLPGGNPYPALIPRTPRRPLRFFLHVGRRDLGYDEPPGENWLAENLRTAAALAEAGYDARLVLGDGGHDPAAAGVLLPDALRWALG